MVKLFFDGSPAYIETILTPAERSRLREKRMEFFGSLLHQFHRYESAAALLLQLEARRTDHVVTSTPTLSIGERSELGEAEFGVFEEMLQQLHPWKKGPLELFGVEIDTEWRSDWKWDRISPFVTDLRDKVVADVGCANGYFMVRSANGGRSVAPYPAPADRG